MSKQAFTDKELDNIAHNMFTLLLLIPLFLVFLIVGIVFLILALVYNNPDHWGIAIGFGFPGVLLTGFAAYIIHGTIGLQTLAQEIWHWATRQLIHRKEVK